MGNVLWRQPETVHTWDSSYEEKLIRDINELKLEDGVQRLNIMLWGQIRSGKSALLNSVATIDEKRLAMFAVSANDEISSTARLQIYEPTERMKNFRLTDLKGLQPTSGINVRNLNDVIDGTILPGFKFNDNGDISEENKLFYNDNPSLKDKVHCNIFVLAADVLHNNELADSLIAKVKKVTLYAHSCGVGTIIVLTKIDQVSLYVKYDVKRVYGCPKIGNLVDKAHNLFGISKMNIFPVSNYTVETESNHSLNILVLLALRQAVRYARDHVKSTKQQQC